MKKITGFDELPEDIYPLGPDDNLKAEEYIDENSIESENSELAEKPVNDRNNNHEKPSC